MPETRDMPRQPSAPLPDFCSLPVLFALLVVGALTVTLMWLAPGNDGDLRDYSIAVLFTSWLSILLTVALCKLRPWMQRLPWLLPYAAVWLRDLSGSFALPFIIVAPILLIQLVGLALFKVEYARRTLDSIRQ